MRIALVQTEYQFFEELSELLEYHFTIKDWAEALYDAGIEVTVIYRYRYYAEFTKKGVTYLFIEDSLPAKPSSFQPVVSFLRKLKKVSRERNFDILHFHNLTDFTTNYFARKILVKIPLVVQDHGSVPPLGNDIKSTIKRYLIKKSLADMQGYFFCARKQEIPWTKHGILLQERCEFVLENSSHFRPATNAESTKSDRKNGNVFFLWIGNMDSNKDPMTALEGFSKIVKNFPGSRLQMIFKEGQLINQVKRKISTDPQLCNAVELVEKMDRDKLEVVFNQIDFIISTSLKEGSGYSVIEAMSCGVIPVLSRIPSFEHFTKEGKIGALFDVGSGSDLYRAYQSLSHIPVESLSKKVLDHFEKNLGFEALARSAKEGYSRSINRHAMN